MNIIKDYDVKDDKNEDKECVIILEGMDDIYFIKKLLSNLSADHQKNRFSSSRRNSAI